MTRQEATIAAGILKNKMQRTPWTAKDDVCPVSKDDGRRQQPRHHANVVDVNGLAILAGVTNDCRFSRDDLVNTS
jgi:hypothetical protein